MIAPTFTAAKGNFFDSARVVRAVERAERAKLSKAGAEVRKLAQRSIKMGDRPSPPGSPPHGHRSATRKRVSKRTGKVRVRAVSLLREFLFFSWDEAKKSVVVGPVRMGGVVAGGKAPEALEYGGTSVVRSGKSQRPVRVKARPFMRPALGEATRNLMLSLRDSVRG